MTTTCPRSTGYVVDEFGPVVGAAGPSFSTGALRRPLTICDRLKRLGV